MAKPNPLAPIPHPPTKVIVGNLLTLTAATPVQDMIALAQQLGPIYWLDMMGNPVVIVSGYSLVDELSDESRFDKSTRGFLRRLRFAAHGMFTADTNEARWSKAHNILLPNFSQRAMQGYHPMMLDIAEQLVQKWERLNPDDEIDVTDDMTRLTLETVSLCGFGYRLNTFYREGNHPFVDAMLNTLETTMERRGLPLEDLVLKSKLRKMRADVKYMHEMVEKIVRDRREAMVHAEMKPDLLSYMLAGVDKATGERLDDTQIRDECIIFLIAGHETTSGLLSFTVYFLMNNPDVLAKAYAEVDRVLGPDASVKPTYKQVNQLTWIGQILKESLRLWPTAPAFGLRALADTTIGGQYKLKKRHHIIVLSPALHRDKSVWGDRAEIFDPDRFSPEAEASRPANAYKPFGNGQRACIGRQFALQEATLVLGMILQRFKLIDHTRYSLRVREALTIKPEGLKIKVRMRTDADRAPESLALRSAGQGARPNARREPSLAAQVAKVPNHGTQLAVLFGSNLGTAEEFARHIAESGEARGFAVTLASLDDGMKRLKPEGASVIVTASYNGAAPDNASAFMAWLRADSAAAALAGARYAVFGCGNRDWASTYQVVPRIVDERLETLGAYRFLERGEGDARGDLDGDFQTWAAKLWPALVAELKLDIDLSAAADTQPLYTIETVAAPPVNPIIGSLGAQAMQVEANVELQKRDAAQASQRSTRHLEIRLPDGVRYRPGDHLSVVPRNDEDLVDRAARRFGFAPDAHVRLAAASERKTFLPVDEVIAVRRLLGEYVELQQTATRKQIGTLASHTECPRSKPALAAFCGADDASAARYRSEVLAVRKSLLDLLDEFPACEVPFERFLEMLPLMVPRYYSISSSPLADAATCSITVGVVESPALAGNGVFRGVCSNYLRRRSVGSLVHAFVKETSAGFRLPADPQQPIIMVGPGTGLAPFRGFLQERAAQKAKGRVLGDAMLFFGCRHPDQDYIYADELQRFASQGLMQLHVAFSRRNGSKDYVQHLIERHADAVWDLLERDAVVFVCGDGSKMEPDVRRTLAAIHRRRTGSSEQAAEAWLNDLSAQNRYVLDVWAGN